MSWMKFSLFCQHILTPSSLQQLLLLQDSQSIQTILNQTGETTNRNTIINLMSVCIENWYPRGIRLTCTVVVLIEDHRLETMPWVCGWVSLGHVTVPWVKGLGWFWLKTVKYTCVNLSGDLNWLVAIGGVVIRINKRGKVRREIFGYRNVFYTKRVRQYRCLLVIN